MSETPEAENKRLRRELALISRLGKAFAEAADSLGYTGPRRHALLGAAVAETLGALAETALQPKAGQ